jgi:menaquinone-dependent protoporphyrinogen IX oxidase
MKMLIVYGTTRGYTTKIAGRISQIVRDGAAPVRVLQCVPSRR